MQYIYTGPSWAASSYPVQSNSTNLATEWAIPFVNLSLQATSVLNRINALTRSQHRLPVIWVYNEPILDLQNITGMSMTEFIQRSDWQDVRNECNHYCLSAIASLDLPVLLIGGHSDIVDCNYKNITVACNSWQKWLAELANMPVHDHMVSVNMEDGGNFVIDNAWGAEVIHRFMHEHPEINPESSLVDNVWDILYYMIL